MKRKREEMIVSTERRGTGVCRACVQRVYNIVHREGGARAGEAGPSKKAGPEKGGRAHAARTHTDRRRRDYRKSISRERRRRRRLPHPAFKCAGMNYNAIDNALCTAQGGCKGFFLVDNLSSAICRTRGLTVG